MKNLKILVLIAGLSLSVFASAEISGVGYAKTNQEAKKEALADLSQVIKSEVRTSFESATKSSGDKGSSNSFSNIKISSNLPILGAEFTFKENDSEVQANVKLIPAKVNALYVKKLYNLNEEINSALDELSKSKSNSLKLQLFTDIYSLLKEYDRYESVALVLGSKLPNTPSITKAKVKSEMAKINSNIESLEMASDAFAKAFTQKKIFIYPPLMQNSTTATEFSSVFQKELKNKLHTASSPKNAAYLLVGEYILTDKAMVLNYELLSTTSNEVVSSKTINIKKMAYTNLETKPKNIDFDALLNSGVISSSDLKVSLNSNRGSQNLLFKDGEDIELFVKLNKMGYLYIVGYTQTKSGKMSYLLELSESDGDSRFTKFINEDDASRWKSLGAFTVEAPFGIESIQVIASNKKINSIPNTKYDEDSGYYLISSDIKKALTQTRGLKKKKSEKAEISEDVMSFTTIK